MSLRKIASVFVLAIVLSIGVGFLQAQTNSGALVGVVRDPSGAVIPNTTVNATNEATGVLYTGKTNANGEYRISNLPEGSYGLRTVITGFTPVAIKGVSVSSTIVSTQDIVLSIGQGTTSQSTELTTIPRASPGRCSTCPTKQSPNLSFCKMFTRRSTATLQAASLTASLPPEPIM